MKGRGQLEASFLKSAGVTNTEKRTVQDRPFRIGDPSGNRTHAFAVRGRRLSRLTMGPCHATCLL